MERDRDRTANSSRSRRTVLAFAGATLGLAGCLSDTPGATGPRNPPNSETSTPTADPGSGGGGGGATERPLQVGTYDFERTDDGRLRVFGTVVNNTDEELAGVVRAGVFYGDESNILEEEVTVPGGGSTEFELLFEIDFEAFAEDGELFVEAAADGE
jgi:hypothetical protein